MPPFVPFPIFPPYRLWQPGQSYPVPVNYEVMARLEEVNPVALPFTSVYFCYSFLRWYAITAPRRAFDYALAVQPLEVLLLWSFQNNRAVIDLEKADIENVLRFYVAPPSSWSAPPVSKYLEDARPFSEWRINPRWRPLNRTYDTAGNSKPIVRQATADRFRVLRDFFSFYLGLIRSKKENPVVAFRILQKLQVLRSPQVSAFTERQLNWFFEYSIHSGQPQALKMAVFLSLARYTDHSASEIVGSELSTTTLDQFQRGQDGWHFSIANDSSGREPLPAQFTAIFDNYLRAAGLSPETPLPRSPLFLNQRFNTGVNKAAIVSELGRFRLAVAAAAQDSSDAEVRAAVALYKKMSFSLVKRSAKMIY